MADVSPVQQPQKRAVQQNNLNLKSIVAFAVSKWYWFIISNSDNVNWSSLSDENRTGLHPHGITSDEK